MLNGVRSLVHHFGAGLVLLVLFELTMASPACAIESQSAYMEETSTALYQMGVHARLIGHDDVLLSWTPVDDAVSYRILYKRGNTGSYSKHVETSDSTAKCLNLTDGSFYSFKVVPLFLTPSGEITLTCNGVSPILEHDESSLFTLKRVSLSNVSRTSAYAHLSWRNIQGESGYQIARSLSSKKVCLVKSLKTEIASRKALKTSRYYTYYFRIRAYVDDDGKRIFGPWSKPYRSLYANPKVYKGRYHFPLARYKSISSKFGLRMCPFHGREFHEGVDIQAKLGTPIYAAAAGKVKKACWGGKYGYVIVLDHGNGRSTLYAHQKKHGFKVKKGQRVIAGQRIGTVGSTGSSTGPHLHWETKVNKRYRSPLCY